MKGIKLILAVLAVITAAFPATAQLRFGVKAGVDYNKVHDKFPESPILDNGRTGFTAGVTSEFMLPLLGLGVDLSVMYTQRGTAYGTAYNAPDENGDIFTNCEVATRMQNYIEIPLNLKYKFGIPVLGNIVKPYIATGPSFAYRFSKDKSLVGYYSKNNDVAWNFGAGVEVIKHLQVGFNYRLGLKDTIKVQFYPAWQKLDAKNNGWQITAAYYF